MDAQMKKEFIKGGEFLISEGTTADVFTPEDFTDEHKMIAETIRDFVDNEVRPNIAAMEKHDWETARRLVHEAGELGLLGANIPEEYGGTALDQMKRTLSELAAFLYRDNAFPHGSYLLTGTGTVPPNDFTLASGDEIRISIGGLGTLVNHIA